MMTKISMLAFLSGLSYLCFQVVQNNAKEQDSVALKTLREDSLERVKYFDELLQIDTVFPLQQTEQVIFDNAQCAVQTGSGYFVASDDGSELYRYHLDGSLDRVVAVKGDGPEELGSLHFGTRMYDNQVGFWDVIKNQIIVFSESGEYRFSLNFLNPSLTKGSWVSPGVAFDWPSPDRLVFANIHVRDNREIRAGITRVHRDERGRVKQLELEQTFGLRDVDFEERFHSGAAYHLALIGDSYWLGSTEFSAVSRYQMATQHFDYMPVSVPDPLTTHDYDGLNPSDTKKLHWLRNYNGFVHEMIPFDGVIFVKIGFRGYVPFSSDGQQLLKRRLMSRLNAYHDVYNGVMFFISNKSNLSFLESKTGVSLLDKESNMAYDEDHPYVVLARLKLEPKAVQKVTK